MKKKEEEECILNEEKKIIMQAHWLIDGDLIIIIKTKTM